jgi:D-alanyl-D-alanine carboxypeptidase/D-alanyl-D-alanine-endopeptidase (penicillin-binding protein 4)
MYQSAAAGNLKAKTGTIRRVSALSGIVRSAEGEAILFSILSNRVPSTSRAKRIEDGIGIELASFSRPLAPPRGD